MNGIYGLVNLDGAPVQSEALSAMQAALDYWAPGKTAIWREDNAGLGCAGLPGTPEAAGERLPLVDALSGLALTAGARLDNRDELLAQLHLPAGGGADGAPITDSQIILQAYLRWGEACVSHLEGDWHFAVWDARSRVLFIGRDQHGVTGLYYVRGPNFFAFASSKKALLALEQTPKKPNLLRLAQLLTAWSGDGSQTGYEAILRLPPAQTLTLTPQAAVVKRYWFPENVSALTLKTDDEYVEPF